MLSDCADGFRGRVVRATDVRACELGLFPGADVHVWKNNLKDAALVIHAGATRYIIPRDVARAVWVSGGGRRRWGGGEDGANSGGA